LAESDRFESVAGNVYFPPPALIRQYLTPNRLTAICAWMDTAHYWARRAMIRHSTLAAAALRGRAGFER
jgi:uncharacterized protein (DUF427 family)